MMMAATEPESFGPEDPRYDAITRQVMEGAEAPGFTPISMPPDVIVDLPGGIVRLDSTVVRQVRVRELNGLAEEKMARAIAKNDIPGYYTAIIEFGLEDPDLDDGERMHMLYGDRTALLLGIRRATFGDTFDMGNYICGGAVPPTEERLFGCGSELHVEIDLVKEVPVKTLDDPHDRFVNVQTKFGVMRFRLPTCSDIDFADAIPNGTAPQRNTAVLSRCLVELDGVEIAAQPHTPEKFVQSMSIKARREAVKAVVEKQPGPQLDKVEVICPDCGYEMTATVDVAATFR